MSQQKGVRFHGTVRGVLGQLTERQQQERDAYRPAAAVVREPKQYEDAVATLEQKQALSNTGYTVRNKNEKKRFLLKDPNSISLGNVLKGQTPLMRREMFRRRLFPIRFEESARNVEEVQQLLMQRQPVGQLIVSFLYLAMLLLFLSCALEITRIFEAADGIIAPVASALAPTPSNFNAISFEIATAEQAGLNPTSVAATPESGRPANISMLTSKAGVASWLLYGFIPLIYGASADTSNLGAAKVLGNCFRLTFRQVCASPSFGHGKENPSIISKTVQFALPISALAEDPQALQLEPHTFLKPWSREAFAQNGFGCLLSRLSCKTLIRLTWAMKAFGRWQQSARALRLQPKN